MPKRRKNKIPVPALARLINTYRLLCQYEKEKVVACSSKEIGKRLGCKADSIRKDISFIGEIGNFGAGYDVIKLKQHIKNNLKLDKKRNVCVVGLGRLGTAVLNYPDFIANGMFVVAGFDSNINKLETIKTTVSLYPAHEITDVVRKQGIEIGVIAVPGNAAQETADRLVAGGVKGIINFAPVAIRLRDNVIIRGFDLLGECSLLSTMMSIKDGSLR